MNNSPWKFVHRHRNPNHPDLRGQWPSEAEGREYNGLLLVPFYDPHRGETLRGWWELRHKISQEALLFVRADGDELAEEYAAKVAELANWQYMREAPDWTSPPHSIELINYLRSTVDVFYQPDFDALFRTCTSDDARDDWEEDVPYSDKGISFR